MPTSRSSPWPSWDGNASGCPGADPASTGQNYTAVYIAAPWDYPRDPEAFIRVLTEIDASPAVLVNDLSLVRWNLSKTYLRDLEARSAAIVPSRWSDEFADDWFDDDGIEQSFRTVWLSESSSSR